MREMVFRERHERVAHIDAIGKMIAKVFNMNGDALFGHIVSEYASEVFQEAYDADLLKRKIDARRKAQKRLYEERMRDQRMMARTERMGVWGDKLAKIEKAKKNK